MSTTLSRREWGARCLACAHLGQALLQSQETNPPNVNESSAVILPSSFKEFTETVTPVNQFFLRNHHREPDLRMAAWTLTIEGRVTRPLQLTFSDLLDAPPVSVEAVLECAGNDAGSGMLVSNGQWEGVALAYLMKKAVPKPDATRILLVGADRGSLLEGASEYPYARIVSLNQALLPEALIALRLNNRFLPRRHGFPARALLPGLYAMNSVKWLERIVVLNSDDMPEAFYASGMDLLYKRTFHKAVPDVDASVSDILVKSRIVSPVPGARLASGPHTITGFAWAGKRNVDSVNISVDGGKTWRLAKLDGDGQPFRWVRWHCDWEATRGTHQLVSRARDSRGNWQPLARDANRRDGYELNWSAPSPCSVR